MTESHQLIKWLKGIGIFAIIWNLMGVLAYLMQAFMTAEAVDALPTEAERALYSNIPAWYTAAFATAVFTGLLASILLLLKKRFATSLFMISLIAILVQMYYNFFISKAMEVYGAKRAIMPILVIILAFFLLWYSRKMDEYAVLS
jgi:uncharacterized membrane protein